MWIPHTGTYPTNDTKRKQTMTRYKPAKIFFVGGGVGGVVYEEIRKKSFTILVKKILSKTLLYLQWSEGLLLANLTLKMPTKITSENLIYLYRLLHLPANLSNILFAFKQTVWTQIRLLLEEQSDLGPHCWQQ